MEGFSEKTREYFPSLNRVNSSNQQIIYLDGPGGTQVPIQVIEAISKYYLKSNANTHGEFITSKEININIATVVEVIIPKIEFMPATVCSILKVLVDMAFF